MCSISVYVRIWAIHECYCYLWYRRHLHRTPAISWSSLRDSSRLSRYSSTLPSLSPFLVARLRSSFLTFVDSPHDLSLSNFTRFDNFYWWTFRSFADNWVPSAASCMFYSLNRFFEEGKCRSERRLQLAEDAKRRTSFCNFIVLF